MKLTDSHRAMLALLITIGLIGAVMAQAIARLAYTVDVRTKTVIDGSWVETHPIRLVMSSTSDWARVMFDDLVGNNTNGIRIERILGTGWIAGNDTDDRIDAGIDLTYVDILYNETVQRTGDIVGFFKGNNDFAYTRMFADLVLGLDRSKNEIYIYLVVAGVGTTTFQLINKETGEIIWQDIISGNGFTQYTRRFLPSQVFFQRTRLEEIVVWILVGSTIVTMLLLNPVHRARREEQRSAQEGL